MSSPGFDINPEADENPVCVAVREALANAVTAHSRMALATRFKWADREAEFIAAWFDLQGAMVPFLESQGTRPAPIVAPPTRTA